MQPPRHHDRRLDGEVIVLAARTSMSPPPDATHCYGPPGLFRHERLERVLVSCTFTWDKVRAEWLGQQWQAQYPGADVLVGGPAYGDPGGGFEPGKFLRPSCTITTRGCPGCAHPCLVPQREGRLRCLRVKPGHIIQDNNLLAAPKEHIEEVLDMLDAQPRAPVFSGGIEARRVNDWFVRRIAQMPSAEMWFAYDAPDELEPVREAVRQFEGVGFTRRHLRCYVLVGYEGDTPEAAERRLVEAWNAGTLPFAMLWRDENAKARKQPEWSALVRSWTRPAAMFAEMSK